MTPALFDRNNTIRLDAPISRRSDVIFCSVAEETVLLDPVSGIYFGLDPVGSAIWTMLETPQRLTELRDALLAAYDVDSETCERAVLNFVQQLEARGLLA